MSSETCIVVGVGPGMGLALTETFGRHEFRIAMVARSLERLEGYAQNLAAEGIEARGFPADVSDAASLRDALAAAIDAFGTPSVLIYNPSLNLGGRPSQLDPEDLVRNFRLNVAGALVATQAVLPGMRAAGSGTILLTGGGLALQPASPEYLSLGIGKVGIRYLAFALAKDLRDEGIHVATITIRGFLKEGSAFDPQRITPIYWDVYQQPRDQWEPELIYEGG
jgi:NAD(P)-dependent dehydrogenase (short-subunit alcohol dehydrogenase family)